MKNITMYFSAEALEALREKMGIILDNNHDYSLDELGELYDRITDDFPYEYGDNGEPLRLGRIFDEIVDALIKLRAPG